jgi:bifunctional non-homologous end joining protein LigD
VAFQRKRPAKLGVKADFPGFIEPALATMIDKVPSGERWLHEIKFDGYRVQVHLAHSEVKVFTRRGNDWTKRFRKIAADAFAINASSAIIDGEVVVPGPNGTTDFSVLQNELKGRSNKIVLVAFPFFGRPAHFPALDNRRSKLTSRYLRQRMVSCRPCSR